MAEAEALPCPVCRAAATAPYQQVAGRDYRLCDRCQAVFLVPWQHPSAEAERAQYCLHENDPGDPRYRAFLSKLALPLLDRLARGSLVLDYGCGPASALAAMLGEAGHEVRLYDPCFRDDRAVLDLRYDAIACSEVVEHFRRPAEEFERLARMLRPGGVLAIMTGFRCADAAFATWHYRRDPTHLVFYAGATLEYLAGEAGWHCSIPARNVALLCKPSRPCP